MNRKSFLRGFGTGVLFSAVILGISFMVRTSDGFVKQRALQLGMEYAGNDSKTVLSSDAEAEIAKKEETVEAASSPNTGDSSKTDEKKDSSEKKENKEGSESKADNETQTAEPVKQTETKNDTTKKSTDKKSSDKEIDMKKEKEKMEKDIRAEQKKLTISAGEWSTTVSKKLQSMGIVKNAADFDKYLDKNGFSSYISAGTYTVSKKDSYRELARKITGR